MPLMTSSKPIVASSCPAAKKISAGHDGYKAQMLSGPRNGYIALRTGMVPDRANADAGVIMESKMNRPCTACLAAVLTLAGSIAHAAPPTVVPSPGYDARLQEQHKALSSAPTSTLTVTRPTNPPVRHHIRRTH
jgi:hypothetical protein